MDRTKRNLNSPLSLYPEGTFPLLEKIPTNNFNAILNQYRMYLENHNLVLKLLFGFCIIACVHNFLIFSEVYLNDFGVQEVMISLLVLFLVPCFIVIGILLKGQFGLRKALKKANSVLPVRKTRKEFNQFIKATIGGYGI